MVGRWIERQGSQTVQIDQTENAVFGRIILQVFPELDRTEIVAQMWHAGRLDAGEDHLPVRMPPEDLVEIGKS